MIRKMEENEIAECAALISGSFMTVADEFGFTRENAVLRKWYESKGFLHTGTVKYDFFPFTCGYMEKDLRI